MAIKPNSTNSTNLTTALGGAPVAGDTVRLNQGNDVYTTGMGFGAIDLQNFLATPAWTGNLGDGSTYLDLICNPAGAGRAVFNWGGKWVYIGGTAGTIAYLEVNPTQNGYLSVSGKTVTTAVVRAGTLAVQDTTDAETVYVSGGKAALTYSAQSGTLLDVSSGIAEVGRVYATVKVHDGGKVVYTRDDKAPSTALEINGGGTVEYVGGDFSALTLRPGGTLDLSRLGKDLTITNATLYEGGTILYPHGEATVTWAGTITVIGRDLRLPR